MAANNHSVFIGNFVKDPVVTEVGQKKTKKATFKLGVNSQFGKDREKNDAVFPQFEAWGDVVEKVIEPYARKGTQAVVHGEYKSESWDDKATGETRYREFFRVTSFQLLGGKTAGNGGDGEDEDPKGRTAKASGKPAAEKPKKPAKPEPDEFDVDEDEDNDDDF